MEVEIKKLGAEETTAFGQLLNVFENVFQADLRDAWREYTRLVECALAATTLCVLPQPGRKSLDIFSFGALSECFLNLFRLKAHCTTGYIHTNLV